MSIASKCICGASIYFCNGSPNCKKQLNMNQDRIQQKEVTPSPDNLSGNKYAKRLIDEWRQHGKIIIAVDFDDTISPWKLEHDVTDCKNVIDTLKVAKEVGAYITVFTACKEDRYPEIEGYCEAVGLNIDSINQNPIELPYGNHAKIYANIFIDDRAGLEEALKILSFAMYTIRGSKGNQNFDV